MQTITQIPIKTFACKLISWYFHQVDKLTSKKYVKTIYLLCTGNKVCVKYQAQVGVNLKPPFRTPLLYATPGSIKFAIENVCPPLYFTPMLNLVISPIALHLSC